MFIQPPVGAWSDKLRTPLGRRIRFFLIGAPISAVAFGLIPLTAVLPLFVACTSTLLPSAALWRTPVVALMPDITPSEFRSQANGIINFMGGIGTIVALQTGGLLYKISPSFPFRLGSSLVLIAVLVVYLFIEEPKEYEAGEQQPGMWQSLMEVVKDPDKSGLRILSAIFFWFIGYSAVDTFFTLYAKNGGLKITSITEPTHTFGDSLEEATPVGLSRGEVFDIEGHFDETATSGPHALFSAVDRGTTDATRAITVGIGGSKFYACTARLTAYETIATNGADPVSGQLPADRHGGLDDLDVWRPRLMKS